MYKFYLRSEGLFAYSDKLQNIGHSGKARMSIVTLPGYACLIHSRKACVLDLTVYRQSNYLCACSLICHKLKKTDCVLGYLLGSC